MAKLTKEIRAKVKVDGEDVVFVLRKPTNEELNGCLAKRYEVSKRGKDVKDASYLARVELFDQLLTGVENLEDDNGPITVGRKSEIPPNWKAEIVFKAFEDNEIEIKN